MLHAGEFFDNQSSVSVCLLCPNHCHIEEGKRGACLARGRDGGRGVSHSFGDIVAGHLDPIEKKPLYHYFPGRMIFSVGSFGCNLKCRFCQNRDISQNIVPGEFVSPEGLAQMALRTSLNLGVAFTYNEPGIWYEYIMEAALLLREKGMKVVLVTNGYLSPEPWKNLCRVTDAMNIDLKGYDPKFYPEVCRGKRDPVLANIAAAVKGGVHVEITNLVVTGLNDDPGPFDEMVDWIADLSPDLPLHLSRYFPRYRETAPETPLETLSDFCRRAKKRLHHVFLGNVAAGSENASQCPTCGEVWIRRRGYRTEVRSRSQTCACGGKIPAPGLVSGTA